MRNLSVLTMLVCLAFANGVRAEVLAAGDTGFSLKVVTTTSASPKDAFVAFIQVAKWWDPEQTHSGDASHLNLVVKPGGALLESIPGAGFARHLKLLYVSPGEEIRLFGGLGPLQAMGVHGVMTVRFKAHENGTEITMLYNVSGFSENGLKSLAPIIDAVQVAQMGRHAAYADSL
jgi:hypothetical protein